MFRLLSVAILREYQYLKKYTASLYSLSIVNDKIYNATISLKHQCIVLYVNYVKIIKIQDLLKSVNLYKLQEDVQYQNLFEH
jgi:hypothetical protein